MRALIVAIDKWLDKTIKHIIGIAMVLLMFSVFIQVLIRYVFNISIKGIDEFPVFLMILIVWFTGITLTRVDGHIKIEILHLLVKNKKIQQIVETAIDVIVFFALIIFTYVSYTYAQFNVNNGSVSPSMGIPMWSITSILMISSFFMMVYYFVKLIRRIPGWRS